jgi:hypothetical protein
MTSRFTVVAAVCALVAALCAGPALAQTAASGLPPSQAQKLRQGNLYVSTDYGAVEPGAKKRPVRKRGSRKRAEPKEETAALTRAPLPSRNPARTGEVDPLAQTETLSGARALAQDILSLEALHAATVETGAVPSALTADGPAAAEAILPCRKFDPTIGRTIEIACE